LEAQYACFNEFPDQCSGCPEYTEMRQDQAPMFALVAGLGAFNPPQFTTKTIKECKRYHKQKVEYFK